MKNIDRMNLTEDFKKRISDIVEDNNYEYKVLTSSTSKKNYSKHSDKDIINFHLEHISSDYLADEGFETVLSNGYVNSGMVVGEFLFRRKK